MLEMVFAKILQMSLIGCYSTLIVLLVRFLLIKLGCERKYIYYLWLAVFLNLCIPVSVSGIFSLIPKQMAEFSLEAPVSDVQEAEEMTGIHAFSPEEILGADKEKTGEGAEQTSKEISKSKAKEEQQQAEERTDWPGHLTWREMQERAVRIGGVVWLAGLLGFLLCNVITAAVFGIKLSGKKRIKWKEEERIAEVEGLASPFVWGLFRPVIYLPVHMEKQEKKYIVAHEKCHRRRKDHLVKLFIFGVTILHWFNPVAWLAYSLCCRDMEISCDEEVLAGTRTNIRKAYAESLLKYAARQNGYLMMPPTFGEPSVKSRIRNVLRYRKKSVILSVLAAVCVLAVALGLLVRPADKKAQTSEQPDLSEELPAPEESTEEPKTEETAEVVNNGGELIQVAGELYYVAGQKLYSDGQKLYASLMGEDGSWAVYIYELDGSGFIKYMDGRIVGWSEEWNIPYVLTTAQDTSLGTPGAPGLYLLGELEPTAVAYTTDDFLGVDEQYAYFSRTEAEGIYLDCYWAGDGTIEKNILGKALPVQMITDFHAKGDYLLFAAGEVQGSAGYFYGDFYSYNRTPGRLYQEHLTDASTFAAADGFIYYNQYSNQGGGSDGIFRASYDFTGEEPLGENLTFCTFDESTGTILAEKQLETPGIQNLVRINPDGSEEQTLLDMEKLLGASQDEQGDQSLGMYLDWEMEEGDKIHFSEINLLGDTISVKAEQWGYREEMNTGWRDSLIRSVYLQLYTDGSGCWTWDPEQLQKDRDLGKKLSNPVASQPCDPEEAGWNLEEVEDGRNLALLSSVPEPGTEADTYWLGETESFTLYGKGDYESMLLESNGQYAEIQYPYTSNYMIPLDLLEADYDGDGAEELSIKFNIKHGTGIYIDTFLMADMEDDGLYVYQLTEEDLLAQLSKHLTFERTEGEGLQARVDGEPAGPAMPDDPERGICDHVSVGNQVHFYCQGIDASYVDASLEFWYADSAVADFNGYAIRASITYEGSGRFVLEDFKGINEDFEEQVRALVTEEYMKTDLYTEGKVYMGKLHYADADLDGGRIEVTVPVTCGSKDSYDYANATMAHGSETEYELLDIFWEK